MANQETLKTLKKVISKIVPPGDDKGNAATFKYVCYGPGESPTFSLRWRIPQIFAIRNPAALTDILLKLNPKICFVYEADGSKRKSFIKVVRRIFEQDRDAKLKPNGDGNITVQIEVEDRLWLTLVEVYKGYLKIGTVPCKLEGLKIEEHVRLFKEGKTRAERGPRPSAYQHKNQTAAPAAAPAAASGGQVDLVPIGHDYSA